MATQIGSLFASIGLQTDALSKDIKKATGMVTKFASQLESLGKDITLKLSAPMAAFGALGVKSFADFEKGMAEVQTIANTSAAGLQELSDGARELSKRLGLELGDSVKGLYEALSANVPKENALSFLETAAKAGIAGVSSTKTSVDGLTSALNAWKIPAEKATEVSDKFFIAIRNGKTNFEQLAGSIGQVAPTAAAFGISIDEVLAAVASLTKQGVKTTESMTQLKASIVAMAKPNKEMATLLEDLGYTSGTAMLKQLGLVNSLEMLRMAAGDLDTLTAALGSTEALGAAMALTGENGKGFAADLADVKESAGATGKAFDVMNSTTSASLARLKASLTDLAVTVGEKLVPHILPLIEKAQMLANSFGQLDAETQGNIISVGLFVAVLGPTLVIIAKVIAAIGTLITWGGQLIALFGSLAKGGAFFTSILEYVGAALGSLPVIITAAGLALGWLLSKLEVFQTAGEAIGGMIYWLYDAIKGSLIWAFDETSRAVSELWEGMKAWGEWIMSTLRAPLDWLTSKLEAIDNAAYSAFENLLSLTGSSAALGPGGRQSMAGRASGGPVMPGTSYLVGEHGPEIFTPGFGGRITANSTATGGGGTSGPSIVIQLTAGVPEAVRAEVSAMLPTISKHIERGILAARDRATPMGRALRA